MLSRVCVMTGERGLVGDEGLGLGPSTCVWGSAEHYGAWLTLPGRNDWALVRAIVSALHAGLRVPVVCKMRLQDSVEATVELARVLEAAGAQMLAVHGRRVSERRRRHGPADLAAVAAVREAVGIPVVSNGNVREPGDIAAALAATGAAGVMSAEGVLNDPALFARAAREIVTSAGGVFEEAMPLPSRALLAIEYLEGGLGTALVWVCQSWGLLKDGDVVGMMCMSLQCARKRAVRLLQSGFASTSIGWWGTSALLRWTWRSNWPSSDAVFWTQLRVLAGMLRPLPQLRRR